jgi:hypothetical protein
MVANPYLKQPAHAFWKTGVSQESPYSINAIYKRKFRIRPNAKIATAGSCFAQHIARNLKANGYVVIDTEPAPPGLKHELREQYGYSLYSARYGNIYTVGQLLQLAREATGEWSPEEWIWERNGRYFDALRPAVEPDGHALEQDVIDHRKHHLSMVNELFSTMDVFVFTLGLTEMWVHKPSGTIYPTAPGTIAGEYNENILKLHNATFNEIVRDLKAFIETVIQKRDNKPFQIILTVSPVPLTAIATDKHVLVSTCHSKSTLRAVCGELASTNQDIDYFPSYEIVTNPRLHSSAFADNLRTVRKEAVANVMSHFFAEHPKVFRRHKNEPNKNNRDNTSEDAKCEE